MKRVLALVPYLIILIVVIYTCLPLLQPGFYTMHDDEQIGRLYDLDQSIKAGHIPPRFVPSLGFGYGYPFFNFYPPFAYYTGEVFHLLGFGYIVSMKLAVFSAFLLSAIFMYIFAREFFGKWGGTISAISYALLSYKAVDVYVRGAYAEFFAFVPLPLIFHAVYRISKSPKSWFILWNSLAVAVLILSHNLIALMSTPFIGVWILYCLYLSKKRLRFFIEVVISFLLGFGLSAYFFIPSYLERGQTIINILTTELADYSLYFVCTYQLWDSMWGYGGSIPSCFDGLSFEIGKVQLILSFIVFLIAVWRLFKHSKEKLVNFVIILFFGMLAFSMFLMVKFSRPLWDVLPPLWYVQFPWRYLLFSGFFASFLTGGVVLIFKRDLFRAALVIIILIPLLYFSIGRFVPQRTFNATDEFYTNFEKIRWETSGLAYEYVPSGIQTRKSELNTTKVDITKEEIATTSSQVISGDMEVTEIDIRPHIKKFEVSAETNGVLQINTYSFPGWNVYLDGEKVPYDDNNKLKLIRVSIPEGEHVLEAKYIDTLPKTYGNATSLLSIIGVGAVIIYIVRKNYGKKTS